MLSRTGFPDGSVVNNLLTSAGDVGSIPGLERSPGGGHGNPLQYSDLENSVNCIVCGVTKSQTRSNFHFNIRLIGQFSSRSLMISSLTVKS